MDLQEVLIGYEWRKLKAIASEYGIEKPDGSEWVDLVPEIAEAIEAAGKTEEFLGAAELEQLSKTEEISEPATDLETSIPEPRAAELPRRPSPAEAKKPSDYYQKIGVPLGSDGDKVRYDRHGNRLN